MLSRKSRVRGWLDKSEWGDHAGMDHMVMSLQTGSKIKSPFSPAHRVTCTTSPPEETEHHRDGVYYLSNLAELRVVVEL